MLTQAQPWFQYSSPAPSAHCDSKGSSGSSSNGHKLLFLVLLYGSPWWGHQSTDCGQPILQLFFPAFTISFYPPAVSIYFFIDTYQKLVKLTSLAIICIFSHVIDTHFLFCCYAPFSSTQLKFFAKSLWLFFVVLQFIHLSCLVSFFVVQFFFPRRTRMLTANNNRKTK